MLKEKLNIDSFFEQGTFIPRKMVDYIMDNNDFAFDGINFYQFNGSYWEKVNLHQIRKQIITLFNDKVRFCKVEEVLRLLLAETYVEPDGFNHNRNHIVLKNGTLDISNWVRPMFHENMFFKDDYATIHLDCSYNPAASCPQFMEFLNSIFDGDNERIAVIQELAGYLLTTSTKYHKAFMFYGSGANGKSVLIDTLISLIGKGNVTVLSITELQKQFSRFSIKDKLMLVSSEFESKVMSSEHFKQVVAGDPINAAQKFKDEFTFTPFAKIVFSTNTLPYIKDKSSAIRRRFITVPFERQFSEAEQDNELFDKLIAELDGILLFALDGLKRLGTEDNFTHSQKCDALLDELMGNGDVVQTFINECTDKANDAEMFVESSLLYAAYVDYCRENGYKAYNHSNFGRELKRLGVSKERKQIDGRLKNCYMGIRLK
ncbi:phage/plasmid primase, P4 family [Christensenella hongkongensis]|uniref:DNA primase family protein n=1 Tax=Christensenella hongkongensis TaxID=270498 RepID=UPI002672C026|nr:phage/plasmid primase, P4 family [Christensenella hongkongensis]